MCTSILTGTTATVINILITILSGKSWLTVTLVSSKMVDASCIRMTGLSCLTFINVFRTRKSSVTRPRTVASVTVDAVNTLPPLVTWMWRTFINVNTASLSPETYQQCIKTYMRVIWQVFVEFDMVLSVIALHHSLCQGANAWIKHQLLEVLLYHGHCL